MEVKIEKQNRLEYIDVAKFIAIFFVVLCHVMSKGEIRHIGYSFHLPLFFILNGVTLKIKDDESFGNFLEKKIKSYLIPMFCLGIILIFVEMIKFKLEGRVDDPKFFGTMLIKLLQQKRTYPIWFVGALFFSDIFFYFIVKIGKNKSYFVFIGGVLFLTVAIIFNIYYRYRFFWNIDVALFGVFFVCIGYLFAHKDFSKIREFLLGNRLYSLGIGIILFVLGQILGEYNYHTYSSHLEMWGMNYNKYYLTIPCAVFSSLGIIFISNSIRNKVMQELGKTTLVILAFHQIVTIPLFNNAIAVTWFNNISSLSGDSIQYIFYCLVSSLFSIVCLVSVHYLIIYSPFAFILNKKIKPFYFKIYEKIKLSRRSNI